MTRKSRLRRSRISNSSRDNSRAGSSSGSRIATSVHALSGMISRDSTGMTRTASSRRPGMTKWHRHHPGSHSNRTVNKATRMNMEYHLPTSFYLPGKQALTTIIIS